MDGCGIYFVIQNYTQICACFHLHMDLIAQTLPHSLHLRPQLMPEEGFGQVFLPIASFLSS